MIGTQLRGWLGGFGSVVGGSAALGRVGRVALALLLVVALLGSSAPVGAASGAPADGGVVENRLVVSLDAAVDATAVVAEVAGEVGLAEAGSAFSALDAAGGLAVDTVEVGARRFAVVTVGEPAGEVTDADAADAEALRSRLAAEGLEVHDDVVVEAADPGA